MAGGFAVLKDVFKTWVYKIARWRNRNSTVIPQRIIDRPPTAELRDDQLDTDSLPPYDVLDGILERYVERDEHPTQIEAHGFDRATVRRVIGLVDRAEYKRRQAPPGVRIRITKETTDPPAQSTFPKSRPEHNHTPISAFTPPEASIRARTPKTFSFSHKLLNLDIRSARTHGRQRNLD